MTRPLPRMLLLALALLLAACQPAAAPTPQPPAPAVTPAPAATASPPASDAARTLASLERVDDFPLYVMHYRGDYAFAPPPPQTRHSAPAAFACTGFTARTPAGARLLGRNFDWERHPALLLFTAPPDALASVSMVDISYLGFAGPLPLDDPAALQPLLDAPYLPFDGLNARGLAVGMMAVPHGEGGADPGKATLDSLALIRLLLDYAADVDAALALIERYNVDFDGGPPIHYLIADAQGNSAVVEFLDGRAVVLRNQESWQVSTNFLFAETPADQWRPGCWRYDRASQTLGQAGGVLHRPAAMALLEDVSQPNTIWSLVYDLTRGAVDIAMDRDYEQIYTFELAR